MPLKVPKKLQDESIRFFISKGKNPINPAFDLIESFYNRQKDGSWRHKETNALYTINGEIYKGEPGNYRYDDLEFLEFLKTQDTIDNIGFFIIENKKLAREIKGHNNSIKDDNNKNKYEITQEEIDNIEEAEIVGGNEVENLDVPSAEYLVEGMILENGLNTVAGKSASYKSLTLLYIAHCIVTGLLVFNKYTTKRVPILFLNEENTWSIFKPMIKNIQKGIKNYLRKDADFKELHFLTYQQISLDVDNRVGRAKLEKAIQKTKAKLVIFDSLKRFITFEENDADEVNKFYSLVLKPLMIKYGVTIILIHHVRKDSYGNFRHKWDKKDLLRGSSDFVNIADSILYFERGITNLQFDLYQIKNRLDEEFEAKTIRITANDDAGFIFLEADSEIEKSETDKCVWEMIDYIYRKKIEVFSSNKAMEELFAKAGFKRSVYNFARNKLIDAKILNKIEREKGAYSVDWEHSTFIEKQRRDEIKEGEKRNDIQHKED